MSNSSTPKKKYKNRDQSILEFFDALQKEYLVAQIRSKIYPKAKDRRYYKNRVMEGKRRSIMQISERNNIPSIFTSTTTLDMISGIVTPEWGLPLFTYKNDETKEWMENLDRCNYFSPNSEVAIQTSEGVDIGTIINNRKLLSENVVVIKNRETGEEYPVCIDNVKRIL